MGKLLSKSVKNKADTLHELYKDKFTENFDQNKQFFNSLSIPYSKKVRNLLVGYITRTIMQQKRLQELQAKALQPVAPVAREAAPVKA